MIKNKWCQNIYVFVEIFKSNECGLLIFCEECNFAFTKIIFNKIMLNTYIK